MSKQDTPPMYSCMAPKSDLRRVQGPHDERAPATASGRIRRALAKLRGSARP